MAAGPTYEPISTTTLGANTTSITLSSIPSTYTDLVLVLHLSRNLSGAGDRDIFLRFNGDTGSTYSRVRGYIGGSDANANATSLQLGASGDLAESRALSRIFLQGYSNTTTYKPVLARYGRGGNNGQAFMGTGVWRSTAAINSITIFESTDGFVTGDSVTLYGIAAA